MQQSIDLLQVKSTDQKKETIGQSKVEYKNVGSILTKASGFMNSYDYTLNPYSGCTFGCTYCYAAFFTRNINLRDTWGYWVHVKENALQLLRKQKQKGKLKDKTIYMSSVTDPYQTIERYCQITREILLELLYDHEYHKPRLVIQTRSPLVTRDIDLFKRFFSIQVNMTITTDDEQVRKVFEPSCPSNVVRLKAIKAVHDAGINTCITMTPLLPVKDPPSFAQRLKETGVPQFIIQPFHKTKGRFVAGTREKAMAILGEYNWNDDEYKRVLTIIKRYIPDIGEGKEGFAAT